MNLADRLYRQSLSGSTSSRDLGDAALLDEEKYSHADLGAEYEVPLHVSPVRSVDVGPYPTLSAEEIAERTAYAVKEVIRRAERDVYCLESQCDESMHRSRWMPPIQVSRKELVKAKAVIRKMKKELQTDPDAFGQKAFAIIQGEVEARWNAYRESMLKGK